MFYTEAANAMNISIKNEPLDFQPLEFSVLAQAKLQKTV